MTSVMRRTDSTASTDSNCNMVDMTPNKGSFSSVDNIQMQHEQLSRPLIDVRALEHYFQVRQCKKELRSSVFWRDVFVETIVCMFVECNVIWALTTLHRAMYIPSTTHFGLFAGFFIFALIEGYGPMSGAPMNPAGCWGFFLAGRITFVRLVFYTGGEIAGAAAGAMIGYSLMPHHTNVTVPTLGPGEGLTAAQGMVIEGVLTFNLLFVALACTNHKIKVATMPALPIAFCIGTGIMAAGTHTGGLQNPIVPFGPAVVNQNFKNHWLYWVGPYLGATVGSIVYQVCCYVKERADQLEEAEMRELEDIPNSIDKRRVSEQGL